MACEITMSNRAFINILLFIATTFAVTGLQAQTRPDSRSFEHLWTLYDGIPQRHLTSQQAMLDTIAWKAGGAQRLPSLHREPQASAPQPLVW